MCFVLDASPTQAEQEVYNVVSSVLDDAPRILDELQSYHGANEEIRQVSTVMIQFSTQSAHLLLAA